MGKQSKISYPTGLGWTRSNTSTIGPGPEHDVFTTLVGTVEGCALLYQVLLGLFIVIYYSYAPSLRLCSYEHFCMQRCRMDVPFYRRQLVRDKPWRTHMWHMQTL